MGNGKINYSEFLSATISSRHISEKKLRSVFDTFDTDKSGSLTKSNLRFAMQKLG